MRRTFWRNCIFQRFQSKNRSSGLKFTPIGENGRLSIKIVQNVLFTPCGGRFGQIAFFNVWEPTFALPDWNSRQYMKTVGFLWKCTKRPFHAMRRTFWQKVIFQRFRSKNRSTGLKFTPKRENRRLSIKTVQNVLFTPCGGRFGQNAFFDVFDPKIPLPDWNSRQYV